MIGISVPEPLRVESKVKFLDGSFDLYIKSLDNARRLPKSLTFYLSVPIVNAAEKCMADCKKANSVFPTNTHEAQIRRDFLMNAQGDVQEMFSLFTALSSLVPIEKEDNPHFSKSGERTHKRKAITERSIELWIASAQDEAKAISSAMKYDKQRYKGLKD